MKINLFDLFSFFCGSLTRSTIHSIIFDGIYHITICWFPTRSRIGPSRPSQSTHIKNKINGILVNRLRYTYYTVAAHGPTYQKRSRGIEIIFTLYIQTSIRHSIISNNRKPTIVSFSFWNAISLRQTSWRRYIERPCRVMGKNDYFFFVLGLTLDAILPFDGRKGYPKRSISCNKLSRKLKCWIECFPILCWCI